MQIKQFPHRFVSNGGDALKEWVERSRKATGETESAFIRRVMLERKAAEESAKA